MDLKLNPDDLNTCVACGLCLPHCPTFRITGDETQSPRGRIALMREVQLHDAPITDEVIEAFDSCIQCRGCEPACPSAVPYGHLMERTREALVNDRRSSGWRMRVLLAPLDKPALLRVGSRALGLAQRLRLVPKRAGLPARLPLSSPPLEVSGDDVHLFTGCVMDAWQRDVHLAAQRVLEAAGFGVAPTAGKAPCCGALHSHAGLSDTTRKFATSMIAALDDAKPVIVDSAGCGAAMKDYGRLLGTAEAEAFSARVFDISEFLADHLDRLPSVGPLDMKVAVQDPCHLRHVQRVHLATRTLLAPYVRELVELDDDGLCCGAGGAYSVLQPAPAGLVRDRKLAAIDRVTPDVVASANPGCSMFLNAGGASTVHPIELVDQALRGG
jgi:glycolate oxidase iron-sulfur subunit